MDLFDDSSNGSSVNFQTKSTDQITAFTKLSNTQSKQSTLHSFFSIPKSSVAKSSVLDVKKSSRGAKTKSGSSRATQSSSGSGTSMSSNSLSSPRGTKTRQCPFYKRLPGL